MTYNGRDRIEQMAAPAFMVEGGQERAIVQRFCRGLPVRLLGANGMDVSFLINSQWYHQVSVKFYDDAKNTAIG